MKTFKIEIPEGHEIDEAKSTFENIVFKKANGWAESWEDLELVSGSWVGHGDFIQSSEGEETTANNKNIYPSEAYARRALAEAQLLQLRQQIIGDWEHDYSLNNTNMIHSVKCCARKIQSDVEHTYFQVFTFETRNQALWFMSQHEALLRTFFLLDEVTE